MSLKFLYKLQSILSGFLIFIPVITKIFGIFPLEANDSSLLVIIGLVLLNISGAIKIIDTRLEVIEKSLIRATEI